MFNKIYFLVTYYDIGKINWVFIHIDYDLIWNIYFIKSDDKYICMKLCFLCDYETWPFGNTKYVFRTWVHII